MILQHLTSINRLAVRLTLSQRRKRQFVVAQRSRACDQRPLWKLDIFRLCSLAILTFCLKDLMRGSSRQELAFFISISVYRQLISINFISIALLRLISIQRNYDVVSAEVSIKTPESCKFPFDIKAEYLRPFTTFAI